MLTCTRVISRFSSNAHHHGSLPQQLGVVWDLFLKTDPEGPTLISYAAYPHDWSVHDELLSKLSNMLGTRLSPFAAVPAGTVVVSSCIPPSLPSPSPQNTLRFQRCCVGVGMGLFELVLPNVLPVIVFLR